jgi:MoaA/NifB/PqqE/SkfB family radical SAM enzyme
MTDAIQSLPVLIVNPYSRCNCRCVMCDIWKRDSAREVSWEEFARQLPDIEALGVRWVVFSGGEPLMHPGLFRFCKALRDRGIRVTALSSGLLPGRFATDIVEQVDDLLVSLDGPKEVHNLIRRVANAFELLAEGVRRIRALRPDFPIAARCTVQRLNCGVLTDTVNAARELGLNSLSFLAADVHSAAFDHRAELTALKPPERVALTAGELNILDGQIEALAASGGCGGFVLESPAKIRRISHHFRCYLGMEEPVAPACNAPWTSAVVDADGTVRPCFFHAPIGSLKPGAGLREVLNGPEATAFRAGLKIAENPICRQCVCSLNWRSV